LDHFHPPLSERRPWESFHSTWATAIADVLNRDVLPAGYIALEQLHGGAAIEIDVGTYTEIPANAPMLLPAQFPPSSTIEIVSTEGGRTLVAAIELVSPGNKDRPGKRQLFAAKCATYLSRGVGLIVLDVVTSRQVNLHNELVDLLELADAFKMPSQKNIYAVAYRPLHEVGADRIETWAESLTLGEPLPTMPLSLEAEFCLPVDLEASYAEACQRRRFDEVG
jgi:hypothetical protein